MAEKIIMARIFKWDHIMRAAVREGTEIGPYKVWHSIIIARCLSRIPPYHSSKVCKPILFSNFGEARSTSVYCRASGEQHFNS